MAAFIYSIFSCNQTGECEHNSYPLKLYNCSQQELLHTVVVQCRTFRGILCFFMFWYFEYEQICHYKSNLPRCRCTSLWFLYCILHRYHTNDWLDRRPPRPCGPLQFNNMLLDITPLNMLGVCHQDPWILPWEMSQKSHNGKKNDYEFLDLRQDLTGSVFVHTFISHIKTPSRHISRHFN